MKNRKRKICPKCLGNLRLEKDKYLKQEYKYYCFCCNENFYKFEILKTKKKIK